MTLEEIVDQRHVVAELGDLLREPAEDAEEPQALELRERPDEAQHVVAGERRREDDVLKHAPASSLAPAPAVEETAGP